MDHCVSLRYDLPNYRFAMVNRSSSVPPWEQFAGILRGQIKGGELHTGDCVPPSVITFAQQYDPAAGTVGKELAQLQREGLVTSRVRWVKSATDREPPKAVP